MSRRKITAGSTSITVPVFVQDTSSTTGAGLGSLAYNTAGLAAKYRREGQSSWTTITLATATVGTFTSGGFVSDGGPVTGGYEFGVPDAVLAASAKWAEVLIYGAANMLPVLIEFELDTVNYQATNGKLPVTLASTDVTGNVASDVQTIKTRALTAAADITFGVYVGGSGAAALEETSQTILLDTNELQTDWVNGGRLDLILDARASQASVDDLPTNTELATALGTADDAVLSAIASLNDITASDVWTSVERTLTSGANIQLPSNGLANITAWTVSITGNLSGSVGSVSSAITLPTIPSNWITADGIATDAIGSLEISGAGVTEIATAVDAALSTAHGAGSWLTGSSGGGTGARAVTITVNDGSTALQNALVRMSQGAESYVVATNASGVAVFSLDDATWTVTITKPGYTHAPTTIIVNGTETATYSMTAVTITASDPDLVTYWLTCLDKSNQPESGVVFHVQNTGVVGLSGVSLDSEVKDFTSGLNGLLSVTDRYPGSEFKIWRESSATKYKIEVPADAAGSVELPAVLGRN